MTFSRRDNKMRNKNLRGQRRGAVLVLVVVSLIALIACVALAIDLGLIMAARTQGVAAADAAAMAATRALNGDAANNNNYAGALPAAQQAVTNNKILGTAMTNAQVSLNIGRYVYDSTDQRFEGQFPGPSNENWSLVQATVNVPITNSLAFSKAFNFTPSNIQSVATAAHRPRDVAIILDFSGSMRFQSLTGGLWGGGDNYCNNPDTHVPQFGHFSSVGAGELWATSFTSPFDAANVTTTTSDQRPPVVQDFYTNSTGTPAWSAQPASYGSTPGGDNFLKTNKNASSTYAQTAAGVLNLSSPGNGTRDATFESQGYLAYGMVGTFNGYTTGPAYWGKSFFVWPPDPRAACDWRRLYFYNHGTTTALDDNSRLWDSGGDWKAPASGNYSINYNAILNFIKNVGPNPFPSTLRSGRIVYYTSIPSTIDTSSSPPSNLDQRFWKDYIDYCLGLVDEGGFDYTVICDGDDSDLGYGPDFTWGTVKITAKSTLTGTPKPYMHYADNPKRSLTKFWFGPQSMVEFLGNFKVGYNVANDGRYFWWPGTCHEAPMYACKLGVRAALTDIQTNHPNDLVSMIFFSTPKDSQNDALQRFNRVRVGLGRNYSNMQESLWYPPATIGNANATVTPYDANNVEVPRAFGGTCYSYPLMLAFNQFSGNTSLKTYSSGQPTGDAGGMGRKGAQKMIIFETDGAPNTTANAALSNLGAYNSYYNVRYNYSSPAGSDYPSGVSGYSDLHSTVTSQILAVCNQICASDAATPAGYSSTSKRVKIHCIGFGPVFNPSSSGAAAATSFLDQMQQIGNVNDGMPGYKIIYGSESQVIADLQQAFQKIMVDGIQVTLIQ
jgi:Flp pilus assembly protein TadG